MILVVPVSHTDRDVVDGFIDAFKVFNSYEKHDLLVVCRPSDEIFAHEVYTQLTDTCSFRGSFLHVFEHDGIRGWPRGCNHYWTETVKFLHASNNTKPWLWLEMDMTPLRYGWADTLEQEYNTCGMPFLGNIANTTTVTSKRKVIVIGKHLVGAAIYPPNLNEYSDIWSYAPDTAIAWDVLCQNDFAPHSYETKLIQHCYRTMNYKKHFNQVTGDVCVYGEPTIKDDDLQYHAAPIIDFENAVLVHGCEDDTLSKIVVNEVQKV